LGKTFDEALHANEWEMLDSCAQSTNLNSIDTKYFGQIILGMIAHHM